MKLREDTKILSKLVGKGTLNLQQARLVSSLPLLVIKEKLEISYSNIGAHSAVLDFIDIKNLPFIEMAFLIETLDEKATADFIYGTLKQNKDEFLLEFCMFYKDEDPATMTSINFTLKNEIEILIDNINVKYPKYVPANLKIEMLEHMKTGIYQFKIHAGIINYIQLFIKTNELADRYLVSVIKNKKPKLSNNKEGEIAKVAGPRIIYIDKLPTASDKDLDNIGMGTPKAAHQRRGTWVTLRAERYKNHPLYQVERGIYRKPAWVGDRSTIVHGATYTVIDRENNFGE